MNTKKSGLLFVIIVVASVGFPVFSALADHTISQLRDKIRELEAQIQLLTKRTSSGAISVFVPVFNSFSVSWSD